MSAQTTDTAPPSAQLKGGLAQVLLATLASTIGFWAWMAISPLQQTYATQMGLDEGQISFMLATPVLVGALGRIVVGAMTDRFGGRKMFAFVLLLSAPAVLLVALAGSIGSFPLLMVAGFYLGVTGTIFAVGVPFSSAWFPPPAGDGSHLQRGDELLRARTVAARARRGVRTRGRRHAARCREEVTPR